MMSSKVQELLGRLRSSQTDIPKGHYAITGSGWGLGQNDILKAPGAVGKVEVKAKMTPSKVKALLGWVEVKQNWHPWRSRCIHWVKLRLRPKWHPQKSRSCWARQGQCQNDTLKVKALLGWVEVKPNWHPQRSLCNHWVGLRFRPKWHPEKSRHCGSRLRSRPRPRRNHCLCGQDFGLIGDCQSVFGCQ